MRRIAATVVGLALILAVSPLHAQVDSAAVDSTPRPAPLVVDSVAAPTPPFGAPATPHFERSGWAARFGVGGGFYGIGALRFTGPDAAWTIRAQGSFEGTENDGGPDVTTQQIFVDAGRRWYQPGRGRVRGFHGIGAVVGLRRNRYDYAPPAATARTITVGAIGEVGAAIFFTPELSLGATWSASLQHDWHRSYTNGDVTGRAESFWFSAGNLALEGGFYF